MFTRALRIGSTCFAASTVLVGLLLPLSGPVKVAPTDPIQTANGPVQGSREDGLTTYRGIPYASPPIGDLRWRPPVPPASWHDVLKATTFRPACPQIGAVVPGMEVLPTSEDCLYLNIWTPGSRRTAKLPVMVWVHGGNNTNGSGAARLYWGDRLARKGVLVVTFNYRLGVLGLLAHPALSKESDHGVSGNYLLLDQITLLHWIQTNIAAFGGDPGNVTLFGQSAGAYDICKLIVSPLAKGLFRRAIAESGGDLGPVDSRAGPPSLDTAERAGVAFANQLHVSSIAELRRLPVETILSIPPPHLPPNVDGYIVPTGVYDAYADHREQPADLLVGYTANDGAPAMPADAKTFRADVKRLYGGFADDILALYPSVTANQARQSWRQLQTEEGFAWHSITWARLNRTSATHRTYLYVFSHVPPFLPYTKIGVAHGADLSYVFGFPPASTFFELENPLGAFRDIHIRDVIQAYWTNFAKTGDPNDNNTPNWPLFDSQESALDIGNRITNVALTKRREFRLIDKYIASLRSGTAVSR
jgi:para-nitrobenzyl esterase